jgi:hypothetical protein
MAVVSISVHRSAAIAIIGAISLALATSCALAAEFDVHFRTNNPNSQTAVDHSAWTAFLSKYLVQSADELNRFAYAKASPADKQALKAYVRSLSAVKVTSLRSDEQRAFWINLYNALTIDVVLDHYPVKSIKDISLGGSFRSIVTGGPWAKPLVTVEAKQLSLDNIEHDILRKVWRDARVHYAVNCASIGCPNLMPVAFTAATLDAMLTQGARGYVNHPRGVRVSGQSVRLSQIYSWFKEDFGSSDAAILDHLRTYAEPGLKAQLNAVRSIGGYDYDWSLNEAR